MQGFGMHDESTLRQLEKVAERAARGDRVPERREIHDGEQFVVVRKGATPAFPGQLGFIGGSMGDDAMLVRGVLTDAAIEPELVAL